SRTEAVHTLVSPDRLVGMFFVQDKERYGSLVHRLRSAGGLRCGILLDCDSRHVSIPIFFDYEGARVTTAGRAGLRGYPRPLPSSTAT
ncbi:MAG: hypothetical protein ACREC5_01710, partial [Thermoplasmata archaeon]